MAGLEDYSPAGSNLKFPQTCFNHLQRQYIPKYWKRLWQTPKDLYINICKICNHLRCFLFLALSCTWSSWKPAVSSRSSSKLTWHWDAWMVWVVHHTKAHGGRHCKILCFISQLLDVTGSDHIDFSCFSRHWLASLRTAWLLTSLACFSIPWPMGDRTPVPCRGRHSSAAVLSWIHFSIHHRLSCAKHLPWLVGPCCLQHTNYIIIVQPCKLQHTPCRPSHVI